MSYKDLLKCVTPKKNSNLDESFLLLSERCTSTPVNLSFLKSAASDLDISEIRDEKPKVKPVNLEEMELSSMVHPLIKSTPVPIFGRRNMQQLSNWARKEEFPKLADYGILQPANEQSSQSFDAPSTSQISGHEKLLAKFKIRRDSQASPVSSKTRAKSNERQSNEKQRPILIENQKPVPKVKPERPKSPRLLTKLRATYRKNKESVTPLKIADKKVKESIGGESAGSKIFNKYKITIPESPKLGKRRALLKNTF